MDKGPFAAFHAPMPSEQCLRLHDADDFRQMILDAHSIFDQQPALMVIQRHPLAQFAAQDLVFLAQVVILQGKVTVEQILDYGKQRSSGSRQARHRGTGATLEFFDDLDQFIGVF